MLVVVVVVCLSLQLVLVLEAEAQFDAQFDDEATGEESLERSGQYNPLLT